MNTSTADDVLEYWLGSLSGPSDYPTERAKIWFRRSDVIDEEIRRRFGDLVEAARRGELRSWSATPRGAVAVVILIDQFSRNLYRDDGSAFSCDAAAIALASSTIDRGLDRGLHPCERQFLYTPFMHAEDLPLQQRGVALFAQLVADVPVSVRARFQINHDFAARHRDTIVRFGRFPHRNRVLGRKTTPDEQAYLDGGGGFG